MDTDADSSVNNDPKYRLGLSSEHIYGSLSSPQDLNEAQSCLRIAVSRFGNATARTIGTS
jgi:hypothetical protein